MRSSKPVAQGGFTLLEVLVALVIVALGMSALLEMLTQSASNVSALRDKTVAEWIAMNQIALARLSLNLPATGTTQGDVQNCANGDWHWQQVVNAVDAIPGLYSITVNVQRTGNATASEQKNTPLPTTGSTPGAIGSLGANATLGPTAQLGTVTTLSTTGCSSISSAGSSLGGSLGGSLGSNGGPSLSSTPSIGANNFGNGSLGSPDAASVNNSISTNMANAMNSGASGGSKSSNQTSWLVSLTGFRGNTLGAASGESPNWMGLATTATSGSTTGTPGTQTGVTNP